MKTFYFFGDSITLGVNVVGCDAWTALFDIYLKTHGIKIPPATFYRLGARKHSTLNIEARFENEFKARNLPESIPYFIFMCGTVDTAAPNGNVVLEPKISLEYLEKLLLKAKSFGKCLFVSPPPITNPEHNARLADLAKSQGELCAKLEIDYINVHEIITNTYPTYLHDLADGIHPQEMGNATISTIICQSEAIQKWLSDND